MDRFTEADIVGRQKVMAYLQESNEHIVVLSPGMKERFDLVVWDDRNPDEKYYIEIKDRDCSIGSYDTAFLNPEKYANLSGHGKYFLYVCCYYDGIVFFQPTEMPESGITEGEYYISKATVMKGPRIRQKRYLLNFNDSTRIFRYDDGHLHRRDD